MTHTPLPSCYSQCWKMVRKALSIIALAAVFTASALMSFAAMTVSGAEAVVMQDTDGAQLDNRISAYGFTPGISPGNQITISLTKTTNGEEAKLPPGPSVPVSSSVVWTYRITNTSELSVEVELVDDREGLIPLQSEHTPWCEPPGAILLPGAFVECTIDEYAQAGQYRNTAIVTATSVLSPAVSTVVTAVSHYFGGSVASTGITLTKQTNGQRLIDGAGPYIRVGDPVTWTYRITNSGEVTITNLVLHDSPEGAITNCQPAFADALAPRAHSTCLVTGTAKVNGRYVNTATVTGQVAGTRQPVTATAIGSYIGFDSGLVKMASSSTVTLGQEITYTLVVSTPRTNRPILLQLIDILPRSIALNAGSITATAGTVSPNLAANTFSWTYTATIASGPTVTITYKGRLITSCVGELVNRAKLYENKQVQPIRESSVELTFTGTQSCMVSLPLIQLPTEPLPVLANGSFDQGRSGWSELINNAPGRLIYETSSQVPYPAQTPTWFAWLGGFPNEETKIGQTLTVTIPTRYRVAVQFYHLLASAETSCSNDHVEVRIGEESDLPVRWTYGLCRDHNTGGAWTLTPWYVPIDPGLGGKIVTIQFAATLNGSANSNFLVDTVSICTIDSVAGVNGRCTGTPAPTQP